jgi:hypothetical protein
MKLIKRLIPFGIIFSVIFAVIRHSSFYNLHVLVENLNGVPALFGAIGVIFGVLAAFVIQQQWEQWNALVDAVKGEVDGLEKLYLWANNFPAKIREKVHANITDYLRIIVKEGWKTSERGERSPEIEAIFNHLSSTVYEIASHTPQFATITFALFSRIMDNRSRRLLYSAERIPSLLALTLRFAAFLLIGLSMFVAVRTEWLDYLFTISIACLSYSVFLVLYDLSRPLEPGDWHITTKDYEELLGRIK